MIAALVLAQVQRLRGQITRTLDAVAPTDAVLMARRPPDTDLKRWHAALDAANGNLSERHRPGGTGVRCVPGPLLHHRNGGADDIAIGGNGSS